jgi:hypothetical protein
VSLSATPSGGSTFGGWTGDCNSAGQVTMNGNRQCTVVFNGVSACTPGLVVNVSPAGMALADGWPSPNPVTVTMVASSSGSCSGDAQLRIGLPGDTPRFYVYEAGPTSGCQVSVDVPGGFSTTSYLLNCPLTLGPGGSRTYTAKLWVQPSAGGTIDISSSWKGLSSTDSIFVPTAAVHPLVFVHGIQGSQPPQNKVITDRETGRRVLDPFLGHYQPMLDQLLKMGYEWNKTLFAVAYDWRKSNVDSAAFLRESLAGTVIPRSSALPYDAGDGRADILVHSMGGLVTRAYVQGPDYAFNLRRAIFVATPHKGFPYTYRTWEGLTWGDYVGHAPLASGPIFQFVLDKIIWPSHVAKRYRPSPAELAVSCTFREAVDDFLPSPYSGNVYVFTRDPVPGFWICSPQEVYRWSHSSDPGRAIGSLPQMLPTEDRKDYLVDPVFGSPRPFQYEPNDWLTSLNAGIGTLASRLDLDNIYTIVGDGGDTDEMYRVEPPGYVIGSLLWRYGTVLPFWPFVQEESNGDTLIPLWSTGLKASGLLSLPDGHEIVMDASGSCFGPIVCNTARHSPIMYQDDTQMRHVPRILAGVELPFKTDYWPPILDFSDPAAKLLEVLTLMTACPVDLYVEDPRGRRLGKDPVTGEIRRDIPDAVYTEPGVEPQALLIPNPVPGTYRITAIGYGSGPYSVRVDRTGGDTATLGVFGGETTPGEAATVEIELLPNSPPTADAGPDQSLAAGEGCTAAAALDGTGSSDPDGDSLTYSWTGPMGILEGPNPTAVLPPGTHTLTLTVNDGNGQTASDTVVVTVEDVTPPVLVVPPPVSTEQTSLAGTPVALPVTATDNCGVPTVTSDAPEVFPLGTTTVSFTAVDAHGNTSSATTTVSVVDTTPPLISNLPPPVTVEQATAAGTSVTLPMPTASDICDAAPALTTDHPTPAVFPLGATIVTFTATDASGNVATATTTVTVVDTTPPVLTDVPPPVTVEQTSHRGTPVHLPLPRATDVCDARPRVTSDAPDVFPLGRTRVTFTATDASGNRARATTTVTVVDTRPPVIEEVDPRPDELWPPNHKMRPVRLDVSVKDICDTSPSCRIVSVTSNEPVTGQGDHTSPDWVVTGNLTLDLRAERSGAGNGRLYWIKVRCTDDSGNSSTRTATVRVPHDKSGHDEDD